MSLIHANETSARAHEGEPTKPTRVREDRRGGGSVRQRAPLSSTGGRNKGSALSRRREIREDEPPGNKGAASNRIEGFRRSEHNTIHTI